MSLMRNQNSRTRRRADDHRCGATVVALLFLTGCTPAIYHGAPPPFFLQSLPLQPRLGPDGQLDRARLALTTEEAATSPAAPIVVPIEQVLRVAVLTHPRIQAMLETVVQVRADHITASLLPNPSLGVGYSLAPFPGQRFNATQRQGGPPQFDLALGLLVDWLLFGKRAAAIRTAELEVDVELANYADAGRQLMLGAIDAHFAVLLAAATRQSLQEEHQQLQAFTALVARQVELGNATRFELDRAHTSVALTHRRLVQAAADHDNSLIRFRTFLAGAEGSERAEPAADPIPSPRIDAPQLSALLELAERHRPDLVAGKRELARARAAVVLQQANAWPWLRLSPGFARQYQSRAIGFPDVSSWGIGAEMGLPLFDRNQGNIAAAESMARQAELNLLARRIDVHAEIAQALRDHQAATAGAAILDQDAVGAAERAREGVLAAHASGSRTLLEVLDARAACRDVLREQLRARLELQRTQRRLAAIVGAELGQ